MYVAEQQSLRQIGHAVTMDPAGVRYRLLAAGVTLRGAAGMTSGRRPAARGRADG